MKFTSHALDMHTARIGVWRFFFHIVKQSTLVFVLLSDCGSLGSFKGRRLR